MALPERENCAASVRVERSTWHEGAVAASRISGSGVVKLYVRVQPVGGGDLVEQVRDIYQKLGELLHEQHAGPQNVITEKVFFADPPGQLEPFNRIRAEFYGSATSVPATTYLRQPPCTPGVLCELQARVVFSEGKEEVTVRDLDGVAAPAAGKVVSYRGYDHIYLHNLTGGTAGDGRDFHAQTEHVFARSEEILEGQGLSFTDVIRTWLYVDEMERDYDDLNEVRNAFFARHGVERLPASTGIEGGVYPFDRGGAMDLYVLRTERPVQIDVMHAPTLNEAPVYGSAFSRGLTVTREDRTVAYVSGTASIDENGDVVHVGDIAGQSSRTLLNIEQLLVGSGAAPTDIVRATTYLKRAEDCKVFLRSWRERGFPESIPHTVCRADVCRPDWLCETEVVAIYAPRTPRGA